MKSAMKPVRLVAMALLKRVEREVEIAKLPANLRCVMENGEYKKRKFSACIIAWTLCLFMTLATHYQ